MQKIILVLKGCLVASLLNAQGVSDTLYLKIPSLVASRIVLQFNRNPAFPVDANFSPPSGSWVLKVTGTADASIELMNTEGGDRVEVNGGAGTFRIANHSMLQPALTLSKNLRLQIKNKTTAAEIKTYLVNYDNTAIGTNNNSGSTNIVNTDRTGGGVPLLHNVGSVIYDALYLRKGPSDAVKAKILSYYQVDKSQRNLRIAYADNKFLLPFVNSFSFVGAQASVGLGSLFSSIGGLDVTAFADGMAKFLVKRVKQELSLAFFHKFKKTINEIPDLKTIFPQTSYLLLAIDNEIYNYEQYVQNLREGFKKDLVEIHRNLPGIVDNHPVFFTTHPVAKAGLLTACYMAQQLDDGSHPGDMLAAYPVEYLDSINNKNYKGAIQTIQLLSTSLRDTTNSKGYWVNIKVVRELVNDKEAMRLYLGLLLQEAKLRYESVPYEGHTLVEFLNAAAEKYDAVFGIYTSYRNYILRFGEKVEALNKMINAYEGENSSDSARIEKYAKYFRSSVDLVDYCTQASSLPGIAGNVPDLKLLLSKYFEIGYAAADVAVNITRKNYSGVVNNTVRIYNLVRGEVLVEPAPRAVVALSNVEALSLQHSKAGFKKTLDNLTRYGSFMATVATAKNSDEVEKAIEAAALPVGSSRIKRVSDFNVSLNAYAGLFYGVERIQEFDEGPWQANIYGVTAPIGVAASWGHRFLFFKTKPEWSTSLFLSLIDLGAVAAFRFTDDETEQVPTIELKHIFSPGAFLSLGIPASPLSVNFGAQAGPNLRKVKTTSNEFDDNFYWRFSTSLVVDIPILNFHTRIK